MLFLELFTSFFRIGILSFGGGYASLPLIEQQIINNRGWMTAQEFIDVLTISEMTPGAISINAATFVGTHMAGIPGALVATFGVVLPSLIIVLLLAMLYFKFQDIEMVQGVIQGLRPAVVALIATAGVTIFLTALFGSAEMPLNFANINFISLALIIGCLILFRTTKMGPVKVMLLSGLIGMVVYTI